MIFHDVKQGTDEWHNLRLGKFTASTCADLFMGKTTLGYQKLIYRVAFEQVTGERPESFKSDYMQRGNELEAEAIERYELETFSKVSNGGFCEMNNEIIGCSPDGFVSNGLVQVKCPAYNTMIDAIISKKIPKDYFLQVQFEMMVTGKPWCDLFFYHPKLKSVCMRIGRDEEEIKKIITELSIAKIKVEQIIEHIK